ncbi:MAG: hypothetical protein WAK82_26670 [Streptosporangiaceae bacterium]
MPAGQATGRLGTGREVAAPAFPAGVRSTAHQLTTADGAVVAGLLHRLDGAGGVMAIMHPRQQLAHHPMVAHFLRLGLSVWTQDTRSPNNDISLVHEQALLDAAAGLVFLRDEGFGPVLVFGHSGGGALYAFYIEQASLPPGRRLTSTPAGRPVPLAEAELPAPDGAVFLAPHPGQGAVLLSCIDPSVTDEADPMSIDPRLDMFDPANGFAAAGTPSSYAPDFIAGYRAAQRRRVQRIDALASELAAGARAAREQSAATGDARERRRALAPRIIITYRTDADPRYTDPGLEPNDRAYGSLFGHRPDLTNYGLVGFGRLTTPDSWLSTWSAFSSNAVFTRCAAGIRVPVIYVEFSGDQAAYPADADRMFAALATPDKHRARVRGQHFGQPLSPGEPTGYQAAAGQIGPWLSGRFGSEPRP